MKYFWELQPRRCQREREEKRLGCLGLWAVVGGGKLVLWKNQGVPKKEVEKMTTAFSEKKVMQKEESKLQVSISDFFTKGLMHFRGTSIIWF